MDARPSLWVVITTIVCASMSSTAYPQTEGWYGAGSGLQNPFSVRTGGHYFGEDEPERVKRMSPSELEAFLSIPENLHRVKAKGEVAQLRNRLDSAHALTDEQRRRLIEVLAAVRDHHELELERQYAGRSIDASVSAWHGMTLRASREVGSSLGAQFFDQCQTYSEAQIAAVAPILTAPQLETYIGIQRKRLAHYKAVQADVDAKTEMQ